jgi:hypothetical protein
METLRSVRTLSLMEFANDLLFEAKALWTDPNLISKSAEQVQTQAYWDDRRRTVNFRFLPAETICFGRDDEIEVYLHNDEQRIDFEGLETVGDKHYLSVIDSNDDTEYLRIAKKRKFSINLVRRKANQATFRCKRKVKHARVLQYRKKGKGVAMSMS